MASVLGLIIKATRSCNLRCSYCHDWRTGPGQTMPFQVLAHMTAAALRDGAHDVVSFIWHGGEPLLLPPDFYTKALYLQAHIRSPASASPTASRPTAPCLTPPGPGTSANDIRVSISLDGPAALHDRQRLYASGRPSFRDVLRGVDVLRAHGVPFSVLMVVDEEALALGAAAVFDFFLQHGITSYGLLAAAPENRPDAPPGTPAAHYVEPARMAAFLCEMYDRWREHGDRRIRIRELEAMRARVAGQGAGLCTLAGGCFGRYFAVEPNGDVAHCDLFVGDGRYTLGNVMEQSFTQLGARTDSPRSRRRTPGPCPRCRRARSSPSATAGAPMSGTSGHATTRTTAPTAAASAPSSSACARAKRPSLRPEKTRACTTSIPAWTARMSRSATGTSSPGSRATATSGSA